MALDTEKSPLDAPLSVRAKGYGRWNYSEIEWDDPELVRKVHQFSDTVDEKPLPEGTEGKKPVAVKGASRTIPALSPKNPNHHKASLMPPNRFCERKAKYVERKPLFSQTACVNDVLPDFSRLGLYPKDQQIKTAECSNSTQLLPVASEPPVVLPRSPMDSKGYSTSVESLHSLKADCKSQIAFPYSSTPKPLPGKRASPLDASMPLFPTTSLSPELSEDSDFEQHEPTRPKSYLASGALSSSEVFPSWRLHRLSDPKDISVMGTRKQMTADGCPPTGQVRKMSSFQADYWACAIPDCLPPSPDRQSPHWDPNKEYEDLLDYTYPIRPKYKLAKDLKYGIRDSSIHDSGIDLDSLSVSPESTLKSTSVPGPEHRTTGDQTVQSFRTPLSKKPKCSAPVSHYGLSPIGKVSFADGSPIGRTIFSSELAPGPSSSDSTNIGKQRWEARYNNCNTRDTNEHDCVLRRAAVGTFLRSTRMLSLQPDCCSDEEYLPLPPRLKELERLAQQLTDLSLMIRQPEEDDGFPSVGGNGEHLPLEVCGCDGSQQETDCYSRRADSSRECSEEDLLSNQGCEDCANAHGETTSTDARDFVGTECFETGSEREKEEEGYDRDSLAHHIKVFCCRLEELIRWLHKIAEITDNWIPPRPDVESVKASLQRYLAFKKDLAGHQALTEGVLQDGERLLKSMASSSPVLQRTLSLIAKQSSELESNANRLYESILGALDTLDAGLRKSRVSQQAAGPTESSKWLMSATL
ncbi:PREDICTED: centrosomal protein of 68 kDa [Gekko japonicus]|uniref:Centrosomal protein of 68 kDa n=1 Tax=Gekko japonicus TaxID=146911 RepID=A0ABM1KBZ0_GEKJA|nr:PREDICTED: centrosomal protein of 68 kDa [Gekko japonicus]